MMKSSLSLSLGIALLVMPLVANTHDENSEEQSVKLGSVTYELDQFACSVPGARWEQTGGPKTALNYNDGSLGTATITESGQYDFELSCCHVSSRVDSLLSSPDRIGFGRNTTGGAAAIGFTVVDSLANSGPGTLREALARDEPTWIIFDDSIRGGVIELNEAINVEASDITIDGRESDITVSIRSGLAFPLLQLRGGNMIIAGITIDGNGTQGTAIMPREGSNYWLDHMTVTNFASDDGVSIGQGNRPNTSASEVTISNFLAYNTSKGIQAGGNDNFPNFPLHRTTIHSSILAARDRVPRIQYGGQAHVFNTYIHSFEYGGMDAGRGAIIISENNVFSALEANNSRSAQTGRPAGVGPTGFVFSSGDLFLDSAESSGEINPSSIFRFDIDYEYELMPANQVVDYVNSNAGARNAQIISSFGSTCNVVRESFTIVLD